MGGRQQGVESPAALGRAGGEQHGGVLDTRQFSQAFRLPGVVVASGVPVLLGDRGGHQGRALASLHERHGFAQPTEAGITA